MKTSAHQQVRSSVLALMPPQSKCHTQMCSSLRVVLPTFSLVKSAEFWLITIVTPNLTQDTERSKDLGLGTELSGRVSSMQETLGSYPA